MPNKTFINETSTTNQSKSLITYMYPNSTKIIKLNNDVSSFLDPVLSLDNHAKEIILLSTAFVTMLLSTCFMLFLIWFCCYIACKDRNARQAEQRVGKSITETETNLNEIGLNLKQPTQTMNNFDYLKTISNTLKTTNEQTLNNFNQTNPYDLIDTKINSKSLKKSKTTSLKKQKLDEKLKVDNSRINEAFAPETDDSINNNNNTNSLTISKYSTLKNRPRLTPSQIEKEFYEYTLECSKRFGDLIQSDVQSNTISLDTFDYLESTSLSAKKPGIYSHNLKVKNKNRISHIRTAFNSENKNLSSQIKISKVKSTDDSSNDVCQIWHI